MNNMEPLILVQSCPVNQAQSPYLEIEDKAEKILQGQNWKILYKFWKTVPPVVNVINKQTYYSWQRVFVLVKLYLLRLLFSTEAGA